jgi:hypothetical protein
MSITLKTSVISILVLRPTNRDHHPSASLELVIRGGGTRSGAAVTITLSNGACSGQPE